MPGTTNRASYGIFVQWHFHENWTELSIECWLGQTHGVLHFFSSGPCLRIKFHPKESLILHQKSRIAEERKSIYLIDWEEEGKTQPERKCLLLLLLLGRVDRADRHHVLEEKLFSTFIHLSSSSSSWLSRRDRLASRFGRETVFNFYPSYH